MRSNRIMAVALALTLAIGAGAAPARAAQSAAPVMLGLTPVQGARPAELNFGTAAALTYGLPVVVGVGGSLVLHPLAVNPGVSGVLSAVLGLGVLGSFASGYIYAGDPLRGALVTLGDFGVIAAASGVGVGLTYLVFGNGSNTSFGLALFAAPLVLASEIGYNWWKMSDLHALVDRRNRETAINTRTRAVAHPPADHAGG